MMAIKAKHNAFVVDEPVLVVTAVAAPKKARLSAVAPSREGLVQFGFFLSPEARRQIRGWAGLNGRTTQDIGDEMMNDWCRKHGLHRLTKAGEG